MKQNPCRYCHFGYKYKNRYGPSYEPECGDCQKLKQHREYLKSQRKYEIGEPISQIDVLLEQEYVYCGRADIPRHIESVKSWQLRSVLEILREGHFYKAVKKEIEENINV